MGKRFTYEEARELLPVLVGLLKRAREAAVAAGTFDEEMQALSQRIFLSGGMHVDVAAAARRRAGREKAVAQARETIEEIEECGARVGDMEDGRLEFPWELDGRDALLCWTLGDDEEDDIRHWREDEEGSPLKNLSDTNFRRDRPN